MRKNIYTFLAVAFAAGLLAGCGSKDSGKDTTIVVGASPAPHAEILEAAKPRSAKELLDACDMIFCLDWACTDTRMRDLPAPAGMDGGVVFERHKALNWLVGVGEKADWDHVPVDT